MDLIPFGEPMMIVSNVSFIRSIDLRNAHFATQKWGNAVGGSTAAICAARIEARIANPKLREYRTD